MITNQVYPNTNMRSVLDVLNVLNVLNVLDVLDVLDVLNVDPKNQLLNSDVFQPSITTYKNQGKFGSSP